VRRVQEEGMRRIANETPTARREVIAEFSNTIIFAEE
jgi:hypothetical protein